MGNIFRELRYALRMLRKNPGSSAVAVIAMALGIGLTASMFSIIDGIVRSTRSRNTPPAERLPSVAA